MAKQPDAKKIVSYPPNSPELESLLSVGYGGMTRKMAEAIVEERKKNPHLVSMEKYEQAMIFLETLAATPQVISKDPGWKRPDDY